MANIFRATGSKFAGAISKRASIFTGRRSSTVVPGAESCESDSDEEEREVQSFLDKMKQRLTRRNKTRKSTVGRRGSVKRGSVAGGDAELDDEAQATLSTRLLSQVRQALGKTKKSEDELSLEALLREARASDENMKHIQDLSQKDSITDLLALMGSCYGCSETQANEVVKFIANEALAMVAKHSQDAVRKVESLTKQLQVAQQKLVEVKSACMKEISTLKAASRRASNSDAKDQMDVSHLDSMQLLDPETRALAEMCMKDKVDELLARKDSEMKLAVEAAMAKSAQDLKQADLEQQRLNGVIKQLQQNLGGEQPASTGQSSEPKMRKKLMGDMFEEAMQQETDMTELLHTDMKNDSETAPERNKTPGSASLATSLSDKPVSTKKAGRLASASTSAAPRKQAIHNVSETPSTSSSRRPKKT